MIYNQQQQEEKLVESNDEYEEFKLKFKFKKSNGNMEDLVVVDTGSNSSIELGTEFIPVADFAESKITKIAVNTMVFGWGSPGCVYIKTASGYKKVCS